jgi:hypothetical protein
VPGGSALLHAAVFGMTDVLDLLVEAGAEVTSLEVTAAAGDVTGWLTPESDLQAQIRALVFAADHQRLPVIDQLIDVGTPVDTFDEVWGRQALRIATQNGRRRACAGCSSTAPTRTPGQGRTNRARLVPA